MSEVIKPSTVLPADRTPYVVTTEDGIELIVEVATPIRKSRGALLMFHPNPAGGGMMDSHVYRKALFFNLVPQTSCYRYWGQGQWTNYARELCRRGTEILLNNF